jgi:hypothetical protein
MSILRKLNKVDILYCKAVESWIGSGPSSGPAYLGMFSWVLDMLEVNRFHNHANDLLSPEGEASTEYSSDFNVIALISS